MADFDFIALGEVMLRLDPGEGRVRTARQFTAWEGGGEYNVARGLRRCFGSRTAVLTALAENEVGHLIEDLILQGGVETGFIRWLPYDGIGRAVRNPLNFTERGFGVRGAKGCADRGHSAASQLKENDFDQVFAHNSVKWFHTGGIFAALSDETAALTIRACQLAREKGATVSYDLNYRASLWQDRGGFAAAQKLNRQIAPHVDVMIGAITENEAVPSSRPAQSNELFFEEGARQEKEIEAMLAEFPNIKTAAVTLRRVHSASQNDWGGLAWTGGKLYRSRSYPDLHLLDRIGGGDGFAAGLIFGILSGRDPQTALEIAVAHGALAMTTPGDTSMATLEEVLALAGKDDARVRR